MRLGKSRIEKSDELINEIYDYILTINPFNVYLLNKIKKYLNEKTP